MPTPKPRSKRFKASDRAAILADWRKRHAAGFKSATMGEPHKVTRPFRNGDYVKFTIGPDDRGFCQDVCARVVDARIRADDDGLIVVSPFVVFCYHPDARKLGQYLPPVLLDLAIERSKCVHVKALEAFTCK